MSPHRTVSRPRDRGFALLITITLLAFLVLLLVSLATLTRVETQVASNNQQLSQARQNALFALNIALGQLQKAAGPDQRVTATAEVLNNTDPTKKKWTGVWDTTTPAAAPTWLVSQATPAAADAPKNNTAALTLATTDYSTTTAVRLVGSKTADTTGGANAGNEVVVPLQPITSDAVPGIATGTTATVGRYGYWVGDEGVKARINLSDPYINRNDTLSLLNRVGTAQRTAWELFSGSTSPTPAATDPKTVITPDMTAQASRMLSAQQIKLLASADSSASSGATDALTKISTARYHDYTLWSAGVQANVKDGGLKWDLSTGFEQSASLPLSNASNLFRLSEFSESAQKMQDPINGLLNAPVDSYTQATGAPAPQKVAFVFTPLVNAAGSTGPLRGPTWHLLRSHYLLYQARNPLASTSTLPARSLYPSGKQVNLGQNTPPALYEIYNALSNNADPGANRSAAGQLVPRLTQAGLAPYINRIFVRFGIKTTYRADVDRYVVKLVMNPIVVLHNPYNVDLSFVSLSGSQNQYGPASGAPKIAGLINLFDSTGAGLPLTTRIKVNGFDYMPAGKEGGAGTKVLDLAKNHLVNNGKTVNLLIPELTLRAGEVRVLYPQTIGTSDSDQPTINNDPPRSATDNTYVTMGTTTNNFGGFLISLLNGVRDNAPYNPVRPSDAGDINPGHPPSRTDPVATETATQYTSYSGPATATEIWCKASDNIQVLFNGIGDSFDIKYAIESTAGDNAYQGIDNSSLTYQLNAGFPQYNPPNGSGTYVKDYTGYIKDNALLGMPASICTTTKYCFAVDLYVKSADHDSDKAARPFITSNPVAFEQQDSAMGAQNLPASTTGTRGFPGVMPAYQLKFTYLDPNQGISNYLSTNNGNAYWGPSREPATGLTNNTLINIPSRPLTSLAELQHANIAIFGYQPYFAVGNSYASPYVPANLDPPANLITFVNAANKPYFLYDLSYLMNQALWDKYFFSSLSQEFNAGSGTWNNTDAALSASIQTWATGQRVIPNPRMVPYNSTSRPVTPTAAANLATLRTAYRQAAASLLTLGSFNINSRSIDAWAAVLGAARDLQVVADGSGSPGPTPVTNATAIPRMTPVSKKSDGSPLSDSTWNGFTALSDAQIRQLAKNIVDEIIRRQGNKVVPGPFRSLGEFVNRSLQNDLSLNTTSNGAKGALQAALDEPTNSLSPNFAFFNSDYQDVKNAQGDSKWKYQWATSTVPASDYLAGQGPTTSTAQGFLLQADILQQIGPFLSARSDTFVIRTFGESINPITGESAGKAWCEAVVQRLPDYVDQTDTKITNPQSPAQGLNVALYDATPPYKVDNFGTVSDNIGITNKTFGRRFKIVSFRWLSAQDI